MSTTTGPRAAGGWTRAGFLRAALGGGAVAAGGIAIGARDGSTEASPTRSTDAEILNVFLALEHAQEDFYRAALAADAIDQPLREYATAAADQEREHIAFLRDHLGSRAQAHRQVDAVRSPQRFRSAAIQLEEAAIAAYIGQSSNLTRPMVAAIAPLVGVEARQVAWIRDLAGVSPAPNAADPGRRGDAVLSDLRSRGLMA
jgi:truncated hemoglobin YjbI